MKVARTRVRGGALTRRLFGSGLQQAWQIFGGAGGRLQRSDRRHRLRNHTAFGRGCPDRGRREAVWRSGGLAVWRSGGLAVWRSGGLAVWRSGGQAVRRSGGQAVRRSGGQAVRRSGGQAVRKDRWRGRRGHRRHEGSARRRLMPVRACERGPALRREPGCSCAIRLESLHVASVKAMHQSAVSHVPPIQGDTTPRFRIRFPRTIGFHRDVRLIAPCRRSNATSSCGPKRLTAGHAST